MKDCRKGCGSSLDHAGIDIPGIKQVFYGVVLLVVVILKPEGVWPWVAKKLGMAERER